MTKMMKLFTFACMSVLLAGPMSRPLFANEPSADDAAKKQEMMETWKKYSTPGKGHKIFASMVGKWKYTSRMWESAEAKPEESTGTSTMKTIMGGRFLQHDTKGKAMGMPFVGMGIMGYDTVKESYDSLWLDSMSTGMMRGTGTFDDATQTLKDSGSFSCPMAKDKVMTFRSEWKITDKNNMVYTMWTPDKDGKEFKMMEITYKRK